MNTHKIAILAIQESHLTDKLADSVRAAFDTRLALEYSPLPESRNAAGVALVFNKGLINTGAIQHEEIIPGRAILASIPWHGDTNIKIMNIYAPNDAKSNGAFWESLNAITSNRPDLKPDLLVGDFNLVEDSLDRLPCHSDDAEAVAALGELKCNLNLVDGWRRTFPDKRGYTHQHAPNASQGRIDRIYITDDLLRPASGWAIDSPLLETDHWLVSVKVSTPDAPLIGRGRWQVPTYILDREEVLSEINRIGKIAQDDIETNRYRRSAENNPQSIFAKLKRDIVALCRTHAKRVHPTITNKLDKLRKQLNEVNNNTLSSEEDRMLDTMVIKTEILELERILFESNRTYAKTKHLVHAETICRDWVRSNRAKKPRDVIFGLYNPLAENTEPERDSHKMAKIAKEYHTQAQSKDRDPRADPDPAKLESILANITTHTTPAQKNDLAKFINTGRIHRAICESANDKAAGLDGVPMELWKKMSSLFDTCSEAEINPYCDIVSMMTETFNDIERNGIDPTTKFNEGWMCPIYKKGERDNIANYRPITVLNTDYKIMTKALANTLAEVAPTLVHRDQAGFIKGRSIYDQVKLAKLMVDFGRIRGENGAIVALDQEKAYDRLLHPYLWKVLEKLGIPQHFINTVKYLYQDASTSVLINGILSDPFAVSRGVRQGDALSCLLFDLGIEPLAATIRASPLRGIELPGLQESIKCKLFADDTMVYMHETDDIRTLEKHALEPWCEVSGAAFNTAKTEVIPIGTREYRTNLIKTRRMNLNSDPIQLGVRIAIEGQPVRVLGAWIGNGVDQATPWTPIMEKIAINLKKWEANHPTTEGRRLISQMIIGGMTQYLAKVQGMPESAQKTLERLIRNFTWSGEGRPPIASSHMSCDLDAGGKRVLDVHAHNEAILLTWVQAYLKIGESRPTWALVADEILRNVTTGEPRSLENDPDARTNQLLQTWQSRKNKRKCQNPDEDDTVNVPNDLREMLKVARKFGVRLEAIHPSQQVRQELPATRSAQTKTQEKPDTLRDKHGKCIRNKHGARTLGDIESMATNVPNNHRRNKKCRCEKCTKLREDTNGGCKHPNKCIERAKKLLGTINEKWNPTSTHPPEFFTHPTPEEVGSRYDPVAKETIHTLNPFRVEETLANCFRVFTGASQPSCQPTTRAPRTEHTEDPPTTIYTDGSCIKNGEETACAGSGVWFGDDDPRNMSLRVPGPNQSNQTGELYAILQAIRSVPPDQALIIRTDSMYAVNGLTSNLEKWEDQGWLRSKHADLFKSITAWMRFRSNTTELVWVKGHSGIRGNEEADKLAGDGALKDLPEGEPHLDPPENTIPNGVKLSTLSQKDFYRQIKRMYRPPPRRSTTANIGRIQACAQEYYDLTPTPEAVWKSTKHKDLTKKTQEFLWKSTHDAFKIRKFWNNIEHYEHRGICSHCGTEESMEHILTECDAPGREQVWSLAKELWHKRSPQQIPLNYGALLRCCLVNFKKDNGEPDTGNNRLFRIIVSESMYMIWKIRCERTIRWGSDPTKMHTTHEIHNKWLQAVNSRL